jgi:hypothetical protein
VFVLYIVLQYQLKNQKYILQINTEENIWNISHFPSSFSEILILREFECAVEHILLQTNLKLDGEFEITWI